MPNASQTGGDCGSAENCREDTRELSDHAIIHYNITSNYIHSTPYRQVKKEAFKNLPCMQAQCNEKISSENSSIHLCITEAHTNLK